MSEGVQDLDTKYKDRTPKKPLARRAIRRKLNEAKQLSITDSLTGLHNEIWAIDNLKRKIAESNRTNQPLYVLYGDYDDFKDFNTYYGHSGGDEVLKLMGFIPTRPDEPISRLHGDEFLQVISHANLTENELADAIRRYQENMASNSSFLLENKPVIEEVNPEHAKRKATLSFGLALYEGENPLQLIKKANSALHYTKRHGKNMAYVALKNGSDNEFLFKEIK